ncbi:MAG: hypothetical protein ACAI38_01125 [Myxococcota bacterium]|nr:hypothetical protein [Myxococcota bacterium]
MRDAIDKRIELHDKHHIEIKLDYAIDPSVKHNRYRVECFFFVPQSLGVNDLSYGRAQFYRASQAYIRFRTPLIALAALASPTNKGSPLLRMKASLEKLQEDGHDEKHAKRISYELRLLACSIRASLRDRVKALIGQMAAAREKIVAVARVDKSLRAVNERNGLIAVPSDGDIAPFPNDDQITRIEVGMDVLLQELAPVIGQLRDFGVHLQDSVVPESLRRDFTNVDEYVSLTVEHYMTSFIEELDKREDDRLAAMRAHVRDILVAEQKRRASLSYPSPTSEAPLDREHFVHRAGILKKFAMSCLFLTIRRREEGRAWADIAASLGAGVGMTASLILTALNEKALAVNSLAFFTATVLAYALRDRMKEWAKRYFGARVTRWVRDYMVDIVDPTTGERIGRCRESFVFAGDKIPSEIAAIRENRVDNLLPKGSPEVVLKYDKHIELEAKLIHDLHGRLHDINDIIRFNVSSLLVRTDDPVQTVHAYDEESDSVKLVECPKVYHVNLIFALRDEQTGRAAQLTRIRVIVDKGGIKRIEEVRAN